MKRIFSKVNGINNAVVTSKSQQKYFMYLLFDEWKLLEVNIQLSVLLCTNYKLMQFVLHKLFTDNVLFS